MGLAYIHAWLTDDYWTIAQITLALEASGASWQQAAQAHRDVLGAVRPANTMLYVAGLIGDGFLVEIEAQAEVEP